MQTPIPQLDLPPVLTTREVATLLRLTPQHITRLARTGVLPHFKLGPRTYRFSRDAVVAWLRKTAVQGAEEHPDGRKEEKWYLPGKFHLPGSEDGHPQALPPVSWDP